MKKKRIVYFELLTIVATFCVVWLHCNSIVHQFSDTTAWKQSLIVEVIAYWAVPVFFMMSGATLMNYRDKYDTKSFFIKRIQKTVIPFIVWSILILIAYTYSGRFTFETFSFRAVIDALLFSKMMSIYWFFLPLFSVYLCIPVLSLLAKNRKILWYIFGMSAVLNSLLPGLFELMGETWNSGLMFPMGVGNVIMAILGYLLATTELSRKQRTLIYIVGICAAAFRYIHTYVFSIKEGQLNKTTWGYTSVATICLATAVFVFFKYTNWDFITRHEKVRKAVAYLATCGFGVYLVHVVVIHWLRDNTAVDVRGIMWRTVGAVGIFAVSVAIVSILRKIPIIKHVIP